MLRQLFWIPIIIRTIYYIGLAKWRNEKGWFIDTCSDYAIISKKGGNL